MSEFMTSKRIVAATLAFGLGIAGCSGSTEKGGNTATSIVGGPEPGKIACKAVNPEQWTSIKNFAVPLSPKILAETLKVDVAAAEAATFGGATCTEAVTAESIDAQTSLVTVEGIGSTCVAVGVENFPASENITAVCAKES